MDEDKWLTLPDDLLVDIFRRLETTAVIRCAGSCRPWRRTVIANASCLRPRPDRFLPELLHGFFLAKNLLFPRSLQYVPASNTPALPGLFTPSTGVGGIRLNGRLYDNPLASRDGFVLLGEDKRSENLCLWSAVTRICTVLPAAAFDTDSSKCIYVLATGYDVSDNGDDDTAVRILAVDWERHNDVKDGTTYQMFTSTSGTWGPVKRSAKLPEDLEVDHVYNTRCRASAGIMVCRGIVSWFICVVPQSDALYRRRRRMGIFSLDLSTERTWTTDVPATGPDVLLAVSEEGQLSVVKMLPSSQQIRVWVLDGDGEWTLRRTIMGVHKLLPSCRNLQLSGFCPRSGYLFGTCRNYRDLEQGFVIGIDGSSPRLVGRVVSGSSAIRVPVEMDCSAYISSYISKMKYF